MKWNMEIKEIEAILEKIWDLHDKLSDAIHSISRNHFLSSIKTLRKPEKNELHNDVGDESRAGFVFVKEFRINVDDSLIQEAKSLNLIRTALENLEDQLEFFHTIQIQQRAERDAAFARLEQSRIILAMRLAEHHGKNYKVIEEPMAFAGDVRVTSQFVSPEDLHGQSYSQSGENFVTEKAKRFNILIKLLVSSLNFARKSLGLNRMGTIVGNAALVAFSMVAWLQLHQVTYKELHHKQEDNVYNRTVRRNTLVEGSSSNVLPSNLGVLLGRG
ncbi:Plastid division protein PDV1 [Quillaja saponaria]|uniref:Plastid division protein PDV1 n=1 Tax=Quillaja saponaria TaxID=32244 RepID=A0AAD7LJF5_QUISA|nr:Plastid division protein PDV1 [Quillaja saponaria]